MMRISAELNHLRMSPRKVRVVADLIRKMPVEEAEVQLLHSKRRAAQSLLKLLRSALANAKHNFYLEPDDLRILELIVNEGVTMKRFRPRARGRAEPIHKRTSHIRIVLSPKTEDAEEQSYADRKTNLQIDPPIILKEGDVHEEAVIDEKAETKDFQKEGRRDRGKRSTISQNRLKEIGKRVFRRKSM